MDIEMKIELATAGYLVFKTIHVAVQSSALHFLITSYGGDGRLYFIRNATVVLSIIVLSGVVLLASLRSAFFSYTALEIITFVMIFAVSMYGRIYGDAEYNPYQEKNNFGTHGSKLQKLETSTDHPYTMDGSTMDLQSIFTYFITKHTQMKEETVDFNTSLENSSGLINSLYGKALSGRPIAVCDCESFSIFPNETTIECLTMNTSTTSSPPIAQKFTCNYVFLCFAIPTFITLLIQVALIVVAYKYGNLLNEHVDNLNAAVGFHQVDDGEGEVNIGFQNNENPQNNLENRPRTDHSDNPQNNIEDGSTVDDDDNPQDIFESSTEPLL